MNPKEYNRYMEFIFLVGCQNYTVDRADLFKIYNLVLGREAILTNLHSSLEKQRERERVIERQREDQYDARRLCYLRHGNSVT
jgi:hypothetical protein